MTSDRSIADTLADLIAHYAQVPRENIRSDSRYVDFGIESLRTMEVVLELERTYNISIPDGDVVLLESIGDTVAYLEHRLQ